MNVSPFTVSQSALVKRLNRKLADDGEYLHTLRGMRAFHDLGRYYILRDGNNIVATHVDPEALGRELGVLRSYETVAEEAA